MTVPDRRAALARAALDALARMTSSGLPRLPIPPLADTCRRFLEVVQPLLTEDEFRHTSDAVADFLQGDGPVLHEAVVTYDQGVEAQSGSYVETWWDDMYLTQRDPILINTSPFFSLQDDPVPERNEQIGRAARFIASLYKFAVKVWEGRLTPDEDRGRPMCMAQHRNLLGTTRLPGLKRDSLVNYPNERHVVVMYRDHMFRLEVADESGAPVSVPDLAAGLHEIVAMVHDSGADPAVPVGLLTTDNRTQWAIVRSEMQTHAVNAQSLQCVERAVFVVCLDDSRPDTMTDEAPLFLHGDGHNRWMDKSIQLVVCANGRVGLPMEHSGYDGHTFLRMANEVHAEAATDAVHADVRAFARRPPPARLSWQLSASAQRAVTAAGQRAAALIAQFDTYAFNFEDFGKTLVTRHKLSPDGLVQMAFQLAYYRHTGRFACTYESVMTKMYQHGRTEALRTVSPASCAMARAFTDSAASLTDRRAALAAGIAAHGARLQECKVGCGVDRHLLALRSTGELLGRRPAIFRDKAYTQVLTRSVLSTSNCASNAIRLFGFGSVVDEGFGIAYTIRDGAIGLCVSSKHLGTRRLADLIVQALREFRTTLEATVTP